VRCASPLQIRWDEEVAGVGVVRSNWPIVSVAAARPPRCSTTSRDGRALTRLHCCVQHASRSVTPRSTVIASTSHGRNAILNIRELLPVLQARGVDLKAHAELGIAKLPPWLGSMVIQMIVKFNAPTRAMVESHANQEELRRVCRDVLDEARKLGISVPRLGAAAPLFSS